MRFSHVEFFLFPSVHGSSLCFLMQFLKTQTLNWANYEIKIQGALCHIQNWSRKATNVNQINRKDGPKELKEQGKKAILCWVFLPGQEEGWWRHFALFHPEWLWFLLWEIWEDGVLWAYHKVVFERNWRVCGMF